jgi:hypothetical protein
MAISGYPGHIFVCKLRYGYGSQSHIEKLEILHNWYSDLRAYLPVIQKPDEYSPKFEDLIVDVAKEIESAWERYMPEFESIQTCNLQEKEFNRSLRGVKERLDVITAESKIIEGIKADDSQEMLAG